MSSQGQGGWSGEIYDKNSQLQYQGALSVLNSHNFQGNEIILDIGCGNGKITKYISCAKIPKGQILGIDQSQNMINFALKNYSGVNIQYRVQRAEDINYVAEFDLIYSTYCFLFVTNKGDVFKRILNALKPNGKLIILTPIWGKKDFCDFRYNIMNELPWKNYFEENFNAPVDHPCSVENYKEFLYSSGLKSIKVEIKGQPFQFKSLQEIHEFITSVTPQIAGIGDLEQRKEYVSEILKRYVARRNSKGEDPLEMEIKLILRTAKAKGGGAICVLN